MECIHLQFFAKYRNAGCESNERFLQETVQITILVQILCGYLAKFSVTFSPTTEKHIKGFLHSLNSSIGASAEP